MVWRKHDLLREVHRQLVEITAIRKRAGDNPDLLERLDGLEASHVCLLRKLLEYFQRGEEKRSSQAQSGKEAGSDLQRFHEAVREHLRGLVESTSTDAVPRAQNVATALTSLRLPESKLKVLPRLDQRCGSCGKILLSSVLAGDEVTRHEKSWYHAKCLETDTAYKKPGLLN